MKKPLRILHIFTNLNRGGAESMVMNYYRTIDKNQIQFDFLVHREEVGAYEQEIKSLGGKIFKISRINPLLPNIYYKELTLFFNSNPYKIVHSHINTFSSYPLKIAKKQGIPIRIAHAHTTTQPVKVSTVLRMPKEAIKILYKGLRRHTVKKYATHLFSCGKMAGNWLYGDAPYSIVPNAIDAQEYKYNREKGAYLRDIFNLNDDFVIGHVGNFSHAKNYPFILKVFKEINSRLPASKLLLIGSGVLETEIKTLAHSLGIFKSTLFLGTRDDIPDLLQLMDVFIFPSHYEGLPLTLIEAQASGLKVFASSTISDEVAISDDIVFLETRNLYAVWASEILNYKIYDRKDNSKKIDDCGYDIVKNADLLQNFYTSSINP